MRRFALVTTCHARGYEAYGRRMVQTFLEHAPPDVQLWLYTEGFEADIVDPRLVVRDLVAASPPLVAFKARHRDNPLAHGQDRRRRFRPQRVYNNEQRKHRFRLFRRSEGFRWDAVRFAHKSFAIFDAARQAPADVLIWVDADTLFFADLNPALLESFVPPNCLLGCLKRRDYTECGFVAYNLRHPAIGTMLGDFERMYTEDLFLEEHEFHDSFLFDVVRRRLEKVGHRTHDIAEGIGQRSQHVLINSVLGSFMDHLKGDRKADGGSRTEDLIVPRPEAYWSQRG